MIIETRAAIQTALMFLGMLAYGAVVWLIGPWFGLATLLGAWMGLLIYFIYSGFVAYGKKRDA